MLLVNVCVSTSVTYMTRPAMILLQSAQVCSDTRKGLFEIQTRYQSNTVF